MVEWQAWAMRQWTMERWWTWTMEQWQARAGRVFTSRCQCFWKGCGGWLQLGRPVAVAATSERAVAVAATLTEMYAAHTHQMVTPITGSTVDRGIMSGTTRRGLWTTGLGSTVSLRPWHDEAQAWRPLRDETHAWQPWQDEAQAWRPWRDFALTEVFFIHKSVILSEVSSLWIQVKF